MPNTNTPDDTCFDASGNNDASGNASALLFDMHDAEAMENDLQRKVNQFMAIRRGEEPCRDKTYIVFDLEFRWDRDAYAAYCVADGENASPKIRWPFDKIAAASWMMMRFRGHDAVPEITAPVIMAANTSSEREMVEALFAALDAEPNAVLVSWGGENRDYPVLRRCAAAYDLRLPLQISRSRPYDPARLDLCMATSVGGKPVHLPELAAALSIPAKPSQSNSIGRLIEQGKWPLVRQQVLADVLSTSVLAVYHLASHGVVACDRADTLVALATAAKLAAPGDSFLTKTFVPWADHIKVRSRLRGVIDAAA